MPKLGLPPLPPVSKWGSYFSRQKFSLPPNKSVDRSFKGRWTLTNRKICDDFVKALRIRPGEVILETFPGSGLLTRSLLRGGNPENTAEIAGRWVDPQTSKPVELEEGFPAWRDELAALAAPPAGLDDPPPTPPDDPQTPHALPQAVIAVEPSADFLVRGFGMSRSLIPKPFTSLPKPDVGQGFFPNVQRFARPLDSYDTTGLRLEQSHLEPNLLFSPSTPYSWGVLPAILNNEDVRPLLERHEGQLYRPWSAPPPPITIVGQMPNSMVGEQMITQWIASVIGAAHNQSSWIWKMGRVRLALIMEMGTYDRIMSKPTDAARCKLSVITNALFHLEPLPPYHHVSNVDKLSRLTESRPYTGAHNNNKAKKYLMQLMSAAAVDEESTTRTTAYPSDFWPLKFGEQIDLTKPYRRPPYLGVMLTPRETSPIRSEQKDAWDYVLRKCFAREAAPAREGIKRLGFGTDNLLPKLLGNSGEYAGIPVRIDAAVRDLEEEEWARVVDVFDKWPFRPEQLLLDPAPLNDQAGRRIGVHLI